VYTSGKVPDICNTVCAAVSVQHYIHFRMDKLCQTILRSSAKQLLLPMTPGGYMLMNKWIDVHFFMKKIVQNVLNSRNIVEFWTTGMERTLSIVRVIWPSGFLRRRLP